MPQDELPINEQEPEQGDGTHLSGVNPAAGSAHETDLQLPPAEALHPWREAQTHELLEMISELEDERRWARLREGIWLALLFHIFVLSAITWIPKYVFHTPDVIDPIDAIKKQNLHYLDLPPDALSKLQQPVIKSVPVKPPVVDKKILDRLQAQEPPAQPTPAPASEQPAPAPQPQPNTAPPPAQAQSQFESPRPSAVPARPSFAMNSTNPAQQMRDAMRASRSSGSTNAGPSSAGHLAMHPGAGAGGLQILSDTQGVDFSGWIQRWHQETLHTWDPLIPDEVNAPILKRGQVLIRFKVLPNGRLMEGSLVLEGRSGDTALDRAAWGALTGSNYPSLPKDFHGPYLELRALFMYNVAP